MPSLRDAPLALNVSEAAEFLRISRAHAYELIARGDLRHVRLGRRVVVPRRAIEEMLDVAVADAPAAG